MAEECWETTGSFALGLLRTSVSEAGTRVFPWGLLFASLRARQHSALSFLKSYDLLLGRVYQIQNPAAQALLHHTHGCGVDGRVYSQGIRQHHF